MSLFCKGSTDPESLDHSAPPPEMLETPIEADETLTLITHASPAVTGDTATVETPVPEFVFRVPTADTAVPEADPATVYVSPAIIVWPHWE
jgi:hypothetical protein